MNLRPWLWWVVNFATRWAIRLRHRVAVHQEGAAPDGAAIVLAKHASSVDIVILADSCRILGGRKPYFQMGSFVGYRFFGPLVPFFTWLGGFPVMRPKEVRRLSRRPGWDRARALVEMRRVNEEAERTRRGVLAAGGLLVVFPEGTRDDRALRPLVSDLEVRTAAALVEEGTSVSVWPVVLSYGARRRPRRRVFVDFRPPFRIEQGDPGRVLDQVAGIFEDRWLPPDAVDLWSAPRASETVAGHR